jgi:pimeloyl-ACP methyl ester carboxylesterase
VKLARLQRRLLLAELIFHGLLGWWLVAGAGVPVPAAIALAFILMALGRAGYVLAGFRLAGIPLRGRGFTPMLRLLAGEWLAFSLTHSLLQPLRPLWRRWLDQPVAAAETGALVVFVHGYCCNAAFWLPMRRRLAGQGVGCQAGIDLEPVFGDIDVMADQLAACLHGLRGARGGRRCIVVAHSMGGLVARSALRRHGSSIMDELITIGTPHGGSRLARLAPGINADQMRPDSAWLQALNDDPASHSVPVTVVASRDDELVAPWQSAMPDFATRRVEFTEIGHLALGYSPAATELIRQASTAS